MDRYVPLLAGLLVVAVLWWRGYRSELTGLALAVCLMLAGSAAADAAPSLMLQFVTAMTTCLLVIVTVVRFFRLGAVRDAQRQELPQEPSGDQPQ